MQRIKWNAARVDAKTCLQLCRSAVKSAMSEVGNLRDEFFGKGNDKVETRRPSSDIAKHCCKHSPFNVDATNLEPETEASQNEGR